MHARIAFTFFAVSVVTPASADDVSTVYPSVVRVVVSLPGANEDDERIVLGSGVAISNSKVITNAHVVGEAEYNHEGRILLVPSIGSRLTLAKLIYIDPTKDLALLEASDLTFSPAHFSTVGGSAGQAVTALGYPGNIDAATIRSVEGYVQPSSPIRSVGVISGSKRVGGIDVFVHTASIARGNSGGPLVNICGRIIGLNTFMTNNNDGDASFAFAVSAKEIFDFLAEAEEKYVSDAGPCLDPSERARLREEAAQKERVRLEAIRQTQDRLERTKRENLRSQYEDERENRIALSLVLVLAGAFAGGAALLLSVKGNRRPFWFMIVAASLLLATAGFVFLDRPSREPGGLNTNSH